MIDGLTSLYCIEFNNKPSNYANAYYNTSSMMSNMCHKCTGKSTSKSHLPQCVYGKPADHDYPAESWWFAFQVYLAAEDEHSG